MTYLIALVVAVAVAVALGRRSPVQTAPQIDHAGLRWRILHGERFGAGSAALVVGMLGAVWIAWVEIVAILWVIAGRPIGWWMVEGPVVANLLAVVAVRATAGLLLREKIIFGR